MKDQLISYETAKLAYENKFDIECDYGYNLVNMRCSYDPFRDLDNSTNKGSDTYSAPTQSLLQKWLREKHYIQIEINWDTICYDVKIWHPDMRDLLTNLVHKSERYNTYEEALEIGLQEGLKLIYNYGTKE
jgi:hypothetical protein